MYKITDDGVLRLSDNAFIPNAPSNKDWQEFQEWIEEGNTPITDPVPTQKELLEKRIMEAREARKRAYIRRLGKTQISAEDTIGDVLDAIIKHLLGDSTEFDIMVSKIQQIKSEIPIPTE